MGRTARAWTGGAVAAALLLTAVIAGITAAVTALGAGDWEDDWGLGPADGVLAQAEVLDVDEYDDWIGATWIDVRFTADGESVVTAVDWYQRPTPAVGDTVTVAYERDDPEWVYDPVEFPVPGTGAADDTGEEPAGEEPAGAGSATVAAVVAGAALVAAVLVAGLTVAWTLSTPRRSPEGSSGSWPAGHPGTFPPHLSQYQAVPPVPAGAAGPGGAPPAWPATPPAPPPPGGWGTPG
jgi:hypothetical protein